MARRHARPEPVPQPLEKSQVRAAGRRRLLAVHPRLATDEFDFVQFALQIALQPKPVPPDDRPDELLRVKVFGNQLPLLSPPSPTHGRTPPTHESESVPRVDQGGEGRLAGTYFGKEFFIVLKADHGERAGGGRFAQ